MGLSLDLIFENPLITLKPNPSSASYLEADLGIIKISNYLEKNDNRLLECNKKREIKETYSDVYNVNINNM